MFQPPGKANSTQCAEGEFVYEKLGFGAGTKTGFSYTMRQNSDEQFCRLPMDGKLR
jgi:hypothetical protein